MKKFAFQIRHLETTDPITVRILENDLGQVPEWSKEEPGVYVTNSIPGVKGLVPTRMFPIWIDDPCFMLVSVDGMNRIVLNVVDGSGNAVDGQLGDQYADITVYPQREDSFTV